MLKEVKITIGNVCFISDPLGKKILLLKRCRNPMKDLYTGVGGKTHPDEDIRSSCIREVKEETGLDVSHVELKGIIKTVLETHNSSWILFVYTAKAHSEAVQACEEGTLEWVDRDAISSVNLIGFIREIIPHILTTGNLIEGTIFHDAEGNVLKRL